MPFVETPEHAREVRLANMLIDFLDENGYEIGNLQDLLEHDGPGTPSELAIEEIIEDRLEPPRDIILLLNRICDENPIYNEDSKEFREYLRQRETERAKQ